MTLAKGVGKPVAAADDVPVVRRSSRRMPSRFAVGGVLKAGCVQQHRQNGDATAVHVLEDARTSWNRTRSYDHGQAALGQFASRSDQKGGQRDVALGFYHGKGFQDFPEVRCFPLRSD